MISDKPVRRELTDHRQWTVYVNAEDCIGKEKCACGETWPSDFIVNGKCPNCRGVS